MITGNSSQLPTVIFSTFRDKCFGVSSFRVLLATWGLCGGLDELEGECPDEGAAAVLSPDQCRTRAAGTSGFSIQARHWGFPVKFPEFSVWNVGSIFWNPVYSKQNLSVDWIFLEDSTPKSSLWNRTHNLYIIIYQSFFKKKKKG